MKINKKLVISTFCKNIIKLFVTVAFFFFFLKQKASEFD